MLPNFTSLPLVIGGRYLTFNTLYGNRVFWLFGFALFAAAFALAALNAPVFVGALAGGAIEWLFAAIIAVQMKQSGHLSGTRGPDASTPA